MAEQESHTVTRLLSAWGEGDKNALDQLIPIVYRELHRIANSYLKQERKDHTLQPTALIHEAYVRLLGQQMPNWEGRTHFFGVAAHLMRQVLVDNARKHRSEKRGGDLRRISLDEAFIFSRDETDRFLALDDALKELARIDERKSRVIELRYFAGLQVEETAQQLGISLSTARRDLRMAEAWLHREMNK
jgi:RNA polymerase sigma factor (TIGR02999 family)